MRVPASILGGSVNRPDPLHNGSPGGSVPGDINHGCTFLNGPQCDAQNPFVRVDDR